MTWLFAAGAALVVGAWWVGRRRLARLRGDARVTDDTIRRIENTGRVEADESLDLQEAAEEEERFWDESWDEPEPW